MLHIKSNLMHSHIRLASCNKCGSNSTTCIDDKEGNIIMEKGKILSRWYEYIGELYNDDRGDVSEIIAEVESPITQREDEHDLKGMPMNKSPGRLHTTQPTHGRAVTAVTYCCANCVEPSRPQQLAPDLPFFWQSGHADPLNGWRCFS